MPKINKDSTLNITFVGIGLCLLCSAIISFIAIQLRSVQENNVVLDMQKKIVSSAGLENKNLKGERKKLKYNKEK
jgi:Na+-transporting NADH:ubiquinone oxidoreductase subunit C